MQNKKSILITVLLITSVLFAVPAAQAADARVYISAASPASSGYAVDQSVTINAKIKWEDLTVNRTIGIQLWNSTKLIEDLENYTIPVQDNSTGTPTLYTTSGKGADGLYSASYTPTASLSEEVGSKTYYLKVLSSDDLTIDSEAVVVLVAADQITMSSVWQDQNNDRVVAANEQVTFTIYTNWAFVENTESHSLYVDYGDGTDVLLATISVTAGSGSQTATASKGFDTTGTKTVTFKLKDSTGSVIKSSVASINVGSSTPAATTTTPAAQTSVLALISGNWQIIAIVVCVVAVAAYFVKGGEEAPKKKKK